MEVDSGTPNQQTSRLHRSVPGVLRRRVLRRNWVISFLLGLLAVLFVIHVASLRRRPRPKATSVWDSGAKARLGVPQLPEDAIMHTNESDASPIILNLGDVFGLEVWSQASCRMTGCISLCCNSGLSAETQCCSSRTALV